MDIWRLAVRAKIQQKTGKIQDFDKDLEKTTF